MTTAELDTPTVDQPFEERDDVRAVLAEIDRVVMARYVDARAELLAQVEDKRLSYKDYTEKALPPLITEAADAIEEILERAFPDVYDRAQVAASVIVPAQRAVKTSRHLRDVAALVMVEDKGWEPVQAYRIMGISRGLFVRVRIKAPKQLPKMSAARAEKQLREHSEVVIRLEPVVEVWRDVRNRVAYQLFESRPDLTNAEIGRLFDTTGQRITILRTKGR